MGEQDVALVRNARAGDRAAFDELVRRTSRLVYARLFLDTGDPHRTEDLVQETLLRAYRSIRQLDDPAGFRPWLLTIAHRCAIDLLRKRAGAPPVVAGLDEIAERQGVPDAWREVSQRLDSERVRGAVATLPGEQRRAIEMAFFDGLTHREIAERDGLPLGTVKGRLRLGLRRLYGLLAEPAPDAEPPVELHRGT